MGVLRPIIRIAQNNRPAEREPSKKIFTPPNALSVSRPLIAADIARKLRHGETGVVFETAVMAATDMEGWLAKLLDKVAPDAGMGASEIGGPLDTWCDAAAVLEISQAALAAPRVSLLGKAAVGVMLTQEGHKVGWALKSAAQHYFRTHELLRLPVGEIGKESMAEKLVALTAAVATNDVENPYARFALGSTAMAFAVSGSVRGELALQGYRSDFAALTTTSETDFAISE